MIQVEQHGPVLAIRMARGLLGRPLFWTTAYWVDGLLIDTGPRCAAPELLKVLSQVQVNQIVVTHGHEENIGGLEDVHARFRHAPIFAPYRAIGVIQEPTRLRLQLYRRVVWGVPKAIKQVRSLDDMDNTIRTTNYIFRVVETPGHSRDHISLFEPTQRWLFSGHAFDEGVTEHWARESDLFSVIGSLQTMLSLRPERLFPSNGKVSRNPRPELAEKIAALQRVSKEVARLDAAGMSVEEMVTCLFKGESSLRLWTSGHYSAANLVEACRSYNALMVATNEDLAGIPPSRPRHPVAPDSPDSSANESADRGDMVR